MIFYTLQGPGSALEIHENKLKIIKKICFSLRPTIEWEINELSLFQISVPKFFFLSGKVEWRTFNGETGSFRFTTNSVMMKKIEVYLQKRVIKNHQRLRTQTNTRTSSKKRFQEELLVA